MTKLMSIIVGGALGLTLAASVGVGVAVGSNSGVKEAQAASKTATFKVSNFSGQGTSGGASDGSSSISATKSNVTFACNNAYCYNTSHVRLYQNSTVTISSNYTIKSIAFTLVSNYDTGLNASYTGLSTKNWSKKVSAQTRFTKVTVTYDDSVSVSSISINGSLSKTSYTFGEAWSHSGLSVVAKYSDNSTATITSGITWNYSPSSTATIGTNSLTVTATVDTFSATHTESVTVSKVASPYLNGVPYQMSLTNTNLSKTYYFIGSMDGYYGATTDDSTSTSIVNMYFEPNGDGQNIYFYSANNTSSQKQYIYISINDTHVNFTYGTSAPSTPWYYNGSTIASYVSSKDSIYGLGTFNKYYTFGAIATYNTGNYFAQFSLVGSLTAENFATQLLSIISCDATGANAPTLNCNYTWNDLSNLYSQLDSTEQGRLQSATANPNGTDIENAMARYDIVVAKYGYSNFINRTISSGSANRMNGIIDSNQIVFITAVLGLLTLTSFAAFYMLRKKKLA